jgi:hypothetical protein
VTTIAVIQPYFVPYAGYFRLFARADVVVMFDCVQFPRRGWVHRNRFETPAHELDWLTLPLEKCDRDTRITDLRFVPDAAARLTAAIGRFPLLRRAHTERHPWMERVLDLGTDTTTYLCELVATIAANLKYRTPMVRSSTLDVAPELKAQDRVLAIVERLGGTRYVNPPGGRELYDASTFAKHGVDLRFLPPYGAAYDSILARLVTGEIAALRAEIEREALLVA